MTEKTDGFSAQIKNAENVCDDATINGSCSKFSLPWQVHLNTSNDSSRTHECDRQTDRDCTHYL